MKTIGHGIDLVENDRIEKIWQDHPEKFLNRVLTAVESQYCTSKRNPVPHMAGRFAAKEAILKVMGTGWKGQISWTDIEITNDEGGQPRVVLSGHTRKIADDLGISRILLSITHTDRYAAASAIGISE